MLVSWPVVSAEPPDRTTIRAPNQLSAMVQLLMTSVITGMFIATIISALTNFERSSWVALAYLSAS